MTHCSLFTFSNKGKFSGIFQFYLVTNCNNDDQAEMSAIQIKIFIKILLEYGARGLEAQFEL
jgi:hypothetical protein